MTTGLHYGKCRIQLLGGQSIIIILTTKGQDISASAASNLTIPFFSLCLTSPWSD